MSPCHSVIWKSEHILLEQWSADSCCVFQVWSDNGFIEVAEHVMVHVSEVRKIIPRFLFALFTFSFICLLKFKD